MEIADSARKRPTIVDGVLEITRTFRAPRALVWAMWTEPEHFSNWFGPHSATMPVCELDPRPGGTIHFKHAHTLMEAVWVAGRFREVVPLERLVMDFHFSDERGGRRDRPGFPGEMRIEVEFADRADGTRMTIRHHGLEVDQGEVQGWMESLERLEARLERS